VPCWQPTIRRSITMPPSSIRVNSEKVLCGLSLARADQTIGDQGLDRAEQSRPGTQACCSRAAVEPVEGRKMQRVPVEQGHQHRRRGLERAIAAALVVRDEADDVVFQHPLEKGRRGVAACKLMALDEFEEVLGKQACAHGSRLVAEILRQGRVRISQRCWVANSDAIRGLTSWIDGGDCAWARTHGSSAG
jgi:hypothetical protein